MEFKGTKGEWFISEINGEFITTDDTNVCRVFKMESKEGNANAKLISCAPEMLEMLIEMQFAMEHLHVKPLNSKLKQLIKKATEI
jgi:hypothetical protein